MQLSDFLQQFIDVILPPSHESVIIRPETVRSFSTLYKPRRKNEILILSQYQDKIVRAAIQANKFNNDRHASILLASLLERHLSNHYMDSKKRVQIIPIPLSRKRQMERGYNQVQSIIDNLSAEVKNMFLTYQALERTRNTKPQSMLSRTNRLQNLNNAFITNSKITTINPLKPIWLLDDVSTTGTTLQQALLTLPSEIKHSKYIQLLAIAG